MSDIHKVIFLLLICFISIDMIDSGLNPFYTIELRYEG